MNYHNSVALGDDSATASQLNFINCIEAKIETAMNMVRSYKQDD